MAETFFFSFSIEKTKLVWEVKPTLIVDDTGCTSVAFNMAGLQNRRQKLDPSAGVFKRPLIDSDDIIIDILSRLPVKSLLRFRCVCKSWHTLISDSHLVRKHLRRAVRGVNANSSKLLISSSPLYSIDYEALEDVNSFVAIKELHLPVPLVLDRMSIVGSCNGLICLHENKGDFFLWNPCTRDTLKLPGVTYFLSSPMFYGFGYDSTIEDYKVIVGGTSSSESGLLTTTIALFTLKSGSWRTVQGLNYVKLNGQGCLLNEALHWVEFEWRWEGYFNVLSSRIISFDLAGEKFQEMVPLSSYLSDQKYISIRIGTTTNCLFVYMFNHSNFSDIAITIWVMKEYGVKESWTKIIDIPSELFRPLQGVFFLNLICILESGEVCMSYSSGLVSYNPKENTFRSVLSSPVILLPEAIMYVETLVSPVDESCADI